MSTVSFLRRGALTLSFLLLLANSALAQQTVDKVTDIQFAPGTYVYQKGDWIDESTLRSLNRYLGEQELPVVLVIADTVEGEVFKHPEGKTLYGYDAADWAVGTHGLMTQPGFKAMVHEDSGLPNASVIFVCPEPQVDLGGKRPWNFYSSPYLDSIGLNWKSSWQNGIESLGVSYLKKGQIDLAVMKSVERYHQKEEAHYQSIAFWKGFWRVLPWAMAIIAFLTAGFVLFIRYTHAAAAQVKALAKLEVWKKALAGKLALLQQLNAKKTSVFGAMRSELDVEGEDLVLATGVISKIGRARILINLANNTVGKVEQLINKPFVGFSTRPFDRALNILKRDLYFDPEENVEAALTGNEIEDQEYLWAPISSFEPVRTSFETLVDTFNKITKEATEEIDSFKEARSEIIATLSEVKENISSFASTISSVKQHTTEEEWARLYEVENEVIPNLQDELQGFVSKATKSPITSLSHVRSLSDRVNEAQASAAAMLDLFEKRPDRRTRYEALEDAGLKLDWLREFGAACFGTVVETLNSLDSDEPDISGAAREQAATFPGLLTRVEELNRKRSLENADRSRVKLRLDTLRAKLSNERGIEPDNLFAESDDATGDNRIPDEALADAERELKKARKMLSQGKLDEAEQLLNQADASTNDAENDIDMWVSVDESYQSRLSEINIRSDELTDEIENAASLLDELGIFDEIALEFRAGDPSNPRANGTVADNCEEIEQALQNRAASLDSAAKCYERGALLAAGDHLTDAWNWNQFITNRIDEIQHKHGNAMAVHADNEEKIPKLLSGLSHQLNTPFDLSTRQSTIDSLQTAFDVMTEAEELHNGELPNPFAIAESVSEAQQIASQFAFEVQRDRDEYVEALESANRAEQKLDSLGNLLDSMEGNRDDLPDAHAFDEADSELKPLRQKLANLQKDLEQAHSDWFVLDDKIDRIYDRASELLLALRQEQQEGEAALAALSQARSKVRSAKNWSGRHVSGVSGNYGKAALRRAISAFEDGDFVEALRQAESASSSASSAISSAEDDDRREIRRRKRQKEEEERRRRRRRQSSYSSSYSSSSSSWGSSSSSSSGFGSFSSGGGGGGFGGFSSGGGGSGW